jgi:hypothetical protein
MVKIILVFKIFSLPFCGVVGMGKIITVGLMPINKNYCGPWSSNGWTNNFKELKNYTGYLV